MPINWALVSQPANWIIIILMILLATFAIGLVAELIIPQAEEDME